MASNINEIITPVIEQLRSPSSSGVSKPGTRGSANVLQDNNAVNPSPGDANRVAIENGNEKPSREDVEKALARVNDVASSLSRELSFTYDKRIDKIIVKVMEGDGERVIRQLPPEEMIRLALQMENIMGMLINQSV